MLAVLSPAKKMDMEPRDGTTTTPDFWESAVELAGVARDLTAADLSKLMHISDALGKLNEERFANFGEQDRKAAVYAFAGDTYQGLEAKTLDEDAMRWADDHLRILSGLYGVLRPRDAIEPYRLEMGSRLKNPRGKNLYDYWGPRLSEALNAQGQAAKTDILVNCASQEYFGAVDQKALNLRVITPVFMEEKKGAPKIVSFYAKKARGSMARFMMENRLTDPEALKDFDLGGYAYQPDLSEGDKLVFVRPAV
ncbi:peroxide stress protein YaaA [Donghicola sp. C2-DW-16]|uniref:UPF0246 protein HJ526_00565 n=1 Tax=Donghicola mangrovi TaxID=2729614 RepID=A0ABX2PA56_9RHOB|nr:peroxide stress protein YaaA [Donghicola mangrovi]NVO25897.1 peroxide stress protein YaaA [Donghicola mangrovi]